MSFIGRILHYIVGEVVVKHLAESRAFQRFALRTDAALQKHKAKIQDVSDKIVSEAKTKGETFVNNASSQVNSSSQVNIQTPESLNKAFTFFKHFGNEIKKEVTASNKTNNVNVKR